MILYGRQPVLYALETCAWRIEEIYLGKEIPKKDFSYLNSFHKPIKKIDSKKAQALARGGNHQGILARIVAPEPLSFREIKERDSLVVLCGISDVGNIGSIVRSSYSLGVEALLLPPLSQKALEGVVRLSSGAFLSMPFAFCENPLDAAHELKEAGFYLMGADMKGEESVLKNEKWALFLGSESSGLSARLKHKLDRMVAIKMSRDFDSLNVAVAAGILIDRICHAQ